MPTLCAPPFAPWGAHSLAEPVEIAEVQTAPEALPTLVRPNDREMFALVFRQMRRLAGPHRDLDDLVQRGMMELHTALPRFRGEASFSTFVAAVCYRVWSKHLRWSMRCLARFGLTRDGQLPDAADPGPSASRQMELAERGRRLYAALDQLSEKRRAAVILHDLQGLELEDIAAVVGCGVTTVRTRLRDGRRALGVALREDPYFCEAEGP